MSEPEKYGKSLLAPLAEDADMRRLFVQSPIVHACFGFYLRRECSWEAALKMAVVELAKSNDSLGKMLDEEWMKTVRPIIVEDKKC